MPKYSPLFWFGAKGAQLHRLRLALPASFDHLIEPFAGSAAFGLAMIEEGFIDSSKVWLNDKNAACMALHSCLRDRPNELVSGLLDIRDDHGLGDEALYLKAVAEIQNPTGNPLDLAKAQYIANRLGFGGKAPGPKNFCNPFKSGHGLRLNEIMRLRRFGALVKGTKQTCIDYREIEPPTANTLQYLDPPYGEGASNTPDSDSYGKDLTISHADFVGHCESLRDQCHLLISYGDTPEAVAAFADWNLYRIPVLRSARTDVNRTELLITNYEIPFSEMLDEEWEIIKEDGVYFPGGGVRPAPGTSASNDNTPPFPNKKYEIIYADPPWPYYGSQTKMGAAGNHYETMPLEEIKALAVQSISAKDSVCFMWATASSMHDVKDVMEAWGFELNPNHFIWRKLTKAGVPYGAAGVRPSYVKTGNFEYLFIGSTKKKGKAPWVGVSDAGAGMGQMVDAKKGSKHSQKPELFREVIMELTGDRTRIELFARRAACDAWDVWGRESGS